MAVYAGRQVKLKIDTAGVGGASATWITIGQQRGGSFGRTSDTVDAKHKDDNGWPSFVITGTPWSMSCDGAMNPADSAWSYLLGRWEAKSQPFAQIDASAIGGEKKEGKVTITDMSYDFPDSDLVSYTLELQGSGPLVTSLV
jgi:predicted secreted protein